MLRQFLKKRTLVTSVVDVIVVVVVSFQVIMFCFLSLDYPIVTLGNFFLKGGGFFFLSNIGTGICVVMCVAGGLKSEITSFDDMHGYVVFDQFCFLLFHAL